MREDINRSKPASITPNFEEAAGMLLRYEMLIHLDFGNFTALHDYRSNAVAIFVWL